MYFERIEPAADLNEIIDGYWVAENEDPAAWREKVIPDGFTEIILHEGDPYRICLDKVWELQSENLLAGQITRHFFLENTGVSKITGIKLKPAALTRLYGLTMREFTDRVVDAGPALGGEFVETASRFRMTSDRAKKIDLLNDYFKQLLAGGNFEEGIPERAIKIFQSRRGVTSVAEVCNKVCVGERQMENIFKKFVGLTPKMYARILRFNYIFELLKTNNRWSDLAYEAAYYDQAHFNRNFKDFTGESPGKYPFNEKNMANFFLQRTPKPSNY